MFFIASEALIFFVSKTMSSALIVMHTLRSCTKFWHRLSHEQKPENLERLLCVCPRWIFKAIYLHNRVTLQHTQHWTESNFFVAFSDFIAMVSSQELKVSRVIVFSSFLMFCFYCSLSLPLFRASEEPKTNPFCHSQSPKQCSLSVYSRPH